MAIPTPEAMVDGLLSDPEIVSHFRTILQSDRFTARAVERYWGRNILQRAL
jgi:hypothetical protein